MSQFGSTLFGSTLFGPSSSPPGDPSVSNHVPSPSSTEVSRGTNISFTVYDSDFLDPSTLSVTIGGTLAHNGESFEPGFSGTVVPAGQYLNVLIGPDALFGSSATVVVAVSVDDVLGNTFSTSWSFQTTSAEGPLLLPIFPSSDDEDIPVSSQISFSLQDTYGVDPSTILVELDRGYGFESAFVYAQTPQFQEGYQGPLSDVSESGGVYSIVVDPEAVFANGATVSVRVTAKDFAGNDAGLV